MTTAIRTIPEGVHAILSPSKAHMWLACMGALAAGRGMPNRPSKYAAEGTVYHDVSRRALLEDQDCTAYVGERYKVGEFEFIVDEDNALEAQKYVDMVRAITGKRYVEVDLDYHELLGVPQTHAVDAAKLTSPDMVQVVVTHIPVASGTGDAVVIDYENRHLHGLDLKFGRGDIVYAGVQREDGGKDPNSQLALYLAAAVARYELLGITDDWQCTGYIAQPRANHFDSHTMTVGELRAWVQARRQLAQGAYALWQAGPDQPNLLAALTPGEKQCRWCPMSGNCKAQDQKILNLFPKGHAAAAIPTLVKLDDVEVAQALDLADEIEHWLSAVRTEGLARVLQGRVLPNWKLVQGRRGNRSLPEDLDAVKVDLTHEAASQIGIEELEDDVPVALSIKDALVFAIGDAAYKPRDIKTVAQLQKTLEKKAPLLWAALQQHITQPDGKPGIARIEDPRPPAPIMTAEFPVPAGATSLI